MRWLILLPLVAAPLPALAEIDSAEACATAVAVDPARAREEAALWERTGGGVTASLCEADALVALGAHGTAAALLTNLAGNPNRVIPSDARAVILTDAARQWLAADRPDLARESLASAAKLTPPDGDRLRLAARAEAAEQDWPAAQATLQTAISADPDDAIARALLAATLRHQDQPDAALAMARSALALDPDLPEAQFETAAALAETGDVASAGALWLKLIRDHPDSDLAAPARANLQRLN